MPIPFLIPLIMAAAGAGIGAATNKKNRGKGALMGAGLGALGGAGLGAMGVGGAAAAGGTAAGAGKAAGLASMLNKAKPILQAAPQVLGAMGGGQQQAEELPPMFAPNAPMPVSPLQSSHLRPMPKQVQLSYNQPYRGYYG